MDEGEIRRRLLAQYGIRIEPAMSRYVLRQLKRGGNASAPFAVMGGDARTGVPRRLFVDGRKLQQPAAS